MVAVWYTLGGYSNQPCSSGFLKIYDGFRAFTTRRLPLDEVTVRVEVTVTGPGAGQLDGARKKIPREKKDILCECPLNSDLPAQGRELSP